MSFLGTALGLEEGARLTGIEIQPIAREVKDTDGCAFAHIVRMPRGENASDAGSAVCAFLPAAIACISGNEADGNSWFAVFQYAPGHLDAEVAEETADDAIFRAVGLTRVREDDVSSLVLTAQELRDAYSEANGVQAWSLPDLVVGLLIQLTNADLSELVKSSNHPQLIGVDLIDYRQQTLHAALAAWAATYEGPEDG